MSVRVTELAYARVQTPDMDTARRFFADFGLIEAAVTEGRVYLRGVGPARQVLILQRGPRKLLSTAFEVGSRGELERLARAAGTSGITSRDEPGGGWQL